MLVYNKFLPIYDEGKCTLFALGRNAMYAACQMIGAKSEDEVLTPAFDCDGSLQPFKVLGLKLCFFRSDPYTFAVDVDDIKKRITLRTKLIHIINHFGMPQPWNELLALRNETGIPILEDNAYSLFSKVENRLFGTFGDMSIFSLRKNLPLIDGGLLRINNPAYTFRLSQKSVRWFYLTEWNGLLNIIKTKLGYYKTPETLRRLVRKFNPAAALLPPPPLYSESERGCPEWPLRDQIGEEFSCDYLRPMSRFARIQLSGFSQDYYAEIINKKRQYYLWLSENLDNVNGIHILWPKLPKGVVPFCFSFLINSNRDIFFEILRKKYDVMAWPTLPKLVLDELKKYPEVELLGRRLLQINLSSDKVILPGFSKYLDKLVRDIYVLSERYL